MLTEESEVLESVKYIASAASRDITAVAAT